jgi:hypothetical protein
MIPQGYWNIENIKENEDPEPLKDRWKYLSIQLKSYYDLLNRGLRFSDNFNSKVLSAEFTLADTDTVFTHGLGFTPTGYITIGLSVAMIVYNGDGTWNNTDIVLKSDVVGTATILVF